MYHDISSVLGDSYVMFYHPSWPTTELTPVCTLDQCIQHVNDRLTYTGRDIDSWNAGDQDQIARLLWVNWIHDNLKHEPIRKPILAHRENNHFLVDCGDTRLMALSLLDRPVYVSLVVTALREDSQNYRQWSPVRNNQELLLLSGFSEHATVMFNASSGNHAINWLEIGDETTGHHLHDISQRVRMMKNYLGSMPADFRFDRAWAKSSIAWADHDR